MKGRPYHRVEFKELKCFDIKKVKSSKDLIIIDWVLGGKPRKKILHKNNFNSVLWVGVDIKAVL